MKIETYKEPKWIAKRNHILKRDKYIDKYLFRYGKFKTADTVHHIFPKEDFPEYQWEDWNLISVSKDTHARLHYRSGNRLTQKGQELLVSTARKNNIDIPYWYLHTEEEGRKFNRYTYE